MYTHTHTHSVEVYIPKLWTLRDPWGQDKTSVSPHTPQTDIPSFSSLQAFKIPRLLHATHHQFADLIIRDGGFIPQPYLATPGATFEQRLETIKGDLILPIYPIRGKLLSGKYVWFSIDTDLSFEQKDACKRVLNLPTNAKGLTQQDYRYKQPFQLTDYLESHSRYGCSAFRIDLMTLLENYRHSRKRPGHDTLPDICFKVGGTKRYKNTATYIIIVSAYDPVTSSDPLPNVPNLTSKEVRSQQLFDPKGLLDEYGRVRTDSHNCLVRGVTPEFRPQGITTGQFDTSTQSWTHHDWDQLDFAFHFPSDSDAKLNCGVFPQRIHHTYCVPLKRNRIKDCDILHNTPSDLEGVPQHLLDRFN